MTERRFGAPGALVVAALLTLAPATAMSVGEDVAARQATRREPAGLSERTNGEVRHSGTLVALDAEARTIRMQEVVAWIGPGTGLATRWLRLSPDTAMQVVMRDPRSDPASMPGFAESSIGLGQLEIGDFVTVTTRADEPVVVSLEVYRFPGWTPHRAPDAGSPRESR